MSIILVGTEHATRHKGWWWLMTDGQHVGSCLMGSMLLTHFSQLLLCNKLDAVPNGIHFFLTVDERNIAPVSHCHFFSEPPIHPPHSMLMRCGMTLARNLGVYILATLNMGVRGLQQTWKMNLSIKWCKTYKSPQDPPKITPRFNPFPDFCN